MSDFTIEQLEALKEGTTPGPWGIDSSDPDWPQLVGAVVLEGNLITQEILAEVGGELNDPNLYLAAAAPALVDALIAEQRAHQKLRKRIEERIRELKQPLCSHIPEGDELDDYLEQWGRQSYGAEILTRILEADNG